VDGLDRRAVLSLEHNADPHETSSAPNPGTSVYVKTSSVGRLLHYYAVKRAIESERFIRPGSQVRPSCLDSFKDFIGEVLEQYPRLRATRLYEMAKA